MSKRPLIYGTRRYLDFSFVVNTPPEPKPVDKPKVEEPRRELYSWQED